MSDDKAKRWDKSEDPDELLKMAAPDALDAEVEDSIARDAYAMVQYLDKGERAWNRYCDHSHEATALGILLRRCRKIQVEDARRWAQSKPGKADPMAGHIATHSYWSAVEVGAVRHAEHAAAQYQCAAIRRAVGNPWRER